MSTENNLVGRGGEESLELGEDWGPFYWLSGVSTGFAGPCRKASSSRSQRGVAGRTQKHQFARDQTLSLPFCYLDVHRSGDTGMRVIQSYKQYEREPKRMWRAERE
jgi:hypothetical protein